MSNRSSVKVSDHALAGGAAFNITPTTPTFLYGYPHTPRLSTGMHDPLLASALYLGNGETDVLFIEVDVIWLSKGQVANVRAQIAARIGIAPERVMVTASHTHSGPVTSAMLSNAEDSAVPPPDPDYLDLVISGTVSAAAQAMRTAVPAEVALTSAECAVVGSNRLHPRGPRITEVPVLAARSAVDPGHWIGLMLVNPVHPTVLHEDSTLISGDFPALCREFLQTNVVGPNCPVLCHLGAAGNQSPRYVTQTHTFAEARRLGGLLGEAINRALAAAQFTPQLSLFCATTAIRLPPRQMPSADSATIILRVAREHLAALRQSDAEPAAIRSAECEAFGAEETLTLARSAATGDLHSAQQSCLPAEIQVFGVGERTFIGWPGEVFVEFALQLRDRHPEAFVITLANGELQGYLVTAEAVRQRCYEAGNAIFASPASGETLVAATLELLSKARLPAAIVGPV